MTEVNTSAVCEPRLGDSGTDWATLRDHPTAEFIESMRRKYPTEDEMDRVLTSKMRRRAEVSDTSFSLEALMDCCHAMLRDHLDDAFETSNARWLSGGASKMQVAFTLDWNDPASGRTSTELVIRLEPAESVNATSRTREFQLLAAFNGTIPVPRVYWLDAEARWFPQPAIVYAFARGVTKPTASTSRVSGIGQTFSPELRAQLGPQFVDHLARIHAFNPAERDLSAFNVPRTGSTESAQWQLNRARRVWDEDRGHDFPLFDVATNWLARNLPQLDRASVLHGDYRAGNFLFDESNGEILTWLDWERGYIGDRHRDLAWTTTRTFGNYAEDGRTFLVSGLIPIDDFFELYEKKSGLSVDMDRIRFYRVLNSYQLMVSALASAYRLVHLGKTHQDVLLAWVEAVGYAMAEDIRQVLNEEFENAE